MVRALLIFGSATLALGLAGCGSNAAAPTGATRDAAAGGAMDMPAGGVHGKVVNAVFVGPKGTPICPVTGQPAPHGKAALSTTYRGVKYYFCCSNCPDMFKSDPAKYAAKP